MVKTFDFWVTFFAAVVLVSAMRVVESSNAYPAMTDSLRETCVTAQWHPECEKEAYRE